MAREPKYVGAEVANPGGRNGLITYAQKEYYRNANKNWKPGKNEGKPMSESDKTNLIIGFGNPKNPQSAAARRNALNDRVLQAMGGAKSGSGPRAPRQMAPAAARRPARPAAQASRPNLSQYQGMAQAARPVARPAAQPARPVARPAARPTASAASRRPI